MNKLFSIILLFFIASLYSCKDNRTDYQKANDYLKEKKYEKAILYFRKSIKSGIDDNPILYRKLAASYIKINKLREAENYLKKALLLAPEDENLKTLYSDILLKRKKYYEATYLLKKLPDSFDKYYKLAEVYFRAHNIKTALSNLEKALSFLENNNEKIKIKYKFALKMLSQKEICIEKNKIFKTLSPAFKDNIDFLINYYKALSCRYKNIPGNRSVNGRYNENKKQRDRKRYEILLKLIKNVPNSFYYNELAQLSIDKNDFNSARKYINESKLLAPYQNRILFLESQIDFSEERYETVTEKLTKFLKEDKNIQALKLIARAEYMNKNYYNSIKYYKELLKEDPYNKNHLYKLKELYELTNNQKELTEIKYKIKFFYRKFYK